MIAFAVLLVAVGGAIAAQDPAYPDEFLRTGRRHYLGYHHHGHNHGVRHSPDGEFLISESAPRAEEEEAEEAVGGSGNDSMRIPLDFLKNFNDYNLTDLLINYVEGEDENVQTGFFQSRFGEDDNSERNAAEMPKIAGCMPELKTVQIVHSDDPTVLYIPQCTRIERCGGCCSHSLLSCQPTETETVSYQVVKTQYTGGKKLKYIGKEIVVVERHTKCKCDCKLKSEDCNQYQKYKKAECSCACTNMDEEKKCSKDTLKKLWNPEVCACQCRDVMQCSTGSYFDNRECRCMAVPMKRRYADYERNKNN